MAALIAAGLPIPENRESVLLIDRLAWSMDEYATVSGFSRAHLYREINEGRLEARKRGKRTFITRDEGLRYLNGATKISGAAAKEHAPDAANDGGRADTGSDAVRVPARGRAG